MQAIFYLLWDHWAHPGYFENQIPLSPALGSGGVRSLANYSVSYEETQRQPVLTVDLTLCCFAVLFYEPPVVYSIDHSKSVVPVLVLICWFVVYFTRRFVLCLTLFYFVLVFYSPCSIAITSLRGRESYS